MPGHISSGGESGAGGFSRRVPRRMAAAACQQPSMTAPMAAKMKEPADQQHQPGDAGAGNAGNIAIAGIDGGHLRPLEGLTAIRKGRPLHTSSRMRKLDEAKRMATVAGGTKAAKAPRMKPRPAIRKPKRIPALTERRSRTRMNRGTANSMEKDKDSASPAMRSPSPYSIVKIGR